MTQGAFRPPERSFALPERYRLRRHVASGGMASVWCADDLVLDRTVAIKILAERFAHDGLAVARFKREARAAARVSGHSHVVTVYDVGELSEPADAPTDVTRAAGRAFIVMEYLAGGTVADAIRHDAVRRPEAMRWLAEAASALDHAHGAGIVHRDIKPANFLLDRARVLHVADFGIARLTSEETITGSDELFGTAAYLAPEQALGREATGASDRYALAVVAFELLSGRRPFSAPHFSAQARQHIEELPPAASEFEPNLSPGVDEVLFAGLAKDPAARPASAGAFVAELTEALDGRLRPAPRPRGRRAAGAALRRLDPAAPIASTAAARRSVPGPDRDFDASSSSGDRRSRTAAFGALAVVIALVAAGAVAAVIAAQRPVHRRTASIADATTTHTATVTTRRAPPTTTHRRSTTHTRTHASATPATSAVQSPAALQSTGHAEMLSGNYASAIPTLQAAVSAAPDDSLTYAYALYDLGRSEVLSGDPKAAIPILRERLRIPNQRGTVKTLLDTAIAQAGDGTVATSTTSSPSSPTTTTPPPIATTPTPTDPGQHVGRGHGNGKGNGGGGLSAGPGPQTATHPTVPLLTAAATG